MYHLGHIGKIRDFLTGSVLSTMLDVVTLLLLVPVLYLLNADPDLADHDRRRADGAHHPAFVRPVRRVFIAYAEAEMAKSTVLVESVRGIRTVKSLGLEPQRRKRGTPPVAAAGGWKLQLLDLINWPQTLITPLEAFMRNVVLLIGAYLAIAGRPSAASLIAFMMLSGRAVAADRRHRPHDRGDRGHPQLGAAWRPR